MIEPNGDLLDETEPVKLTVADEAADELCVLSVVLEIEADTVPDFDIGPVRDWLADPDSVSERRAETLEVVEPVPVLDVETEPLVE